jgi:inosose dehydratase
MLHLSTNEYPWGTFYGRDGRDFGKEMDAGYGEVAASGLNGIEPFGSSPQQVERLGELLDKHCLEMRSIYVGSVLHNPAEVDKSIEHVLAIAAEARLLGTRIIVTNPNPIAWGEGAGKTDEQLEIQAAALDRLGGELAAIGLTLAYHHHDVELRYAAREFHHMMVATDPRHVQLCLDTHWIFRGAGNSAVAVYDVVKLYGARVAELHLRQSAGGVWTEVFAPGDIDYPRIAKELLAQGASPLLVLEQAVEKDSPKTMRAVEAHRRSVAHAREVFAGFEA